MDTSTVPPRTLPRRNSETVAANLAAMREARRQHDRAELEREWRRLTARAPQVRCTRCATLPTGVRCSACVLSGLLPGLRP